MTSNEILCTIDDLLEHSDNVTGKFIDNTDFSLNFFYDLTKNIKSLDNNICILIDWVDKPLLDLQPNSYQILNNHESQIIWYYYKSPYNKHAIIRKQGNTYKCLCFNSKPCSYSSQCN